MNTLVTDQIKDICSKTKGQMSFDERLFITKEINKIDCKNLLIFGAGFDSMFWSEQSANTYILEHDIKWFEEISNKCVDVDRLRFFHAEYKLFNNINACVSAIDTNSSDLDVIVNGIDLFKINWDAIIVDAPTGYRSENEYYRGGSIRLASQLAKEGCLVFIHDVNRKLEHYACKKYFNDPTYSVDRLDFYIND